nr:unnamed protein product [Callosobruchus analis]
MIVRWQLIFGLILASLLQLNAEKSTVFTDDNSLYNLSVTDSSLEFPSKCPMLTECPMRAEPCDDDDDCSADAICCTSPCGKICTKQLFTGCQTLRMAAARRAKALSGRQGEESAHAALQQDRQLRAYPMRQRDIFNLWCVDEAGFEKPGTRAPAAAL